MPGSEPDTRTQPAPVAPGTRQDRSAPWLSGLRARTDHPLVPGLIVAAGTVAFVLVRLHIAAHGDISRFIRAAPFFAHFGQVPRGLYMFRRGGYDGLFYYRLALNPANLHHTAYGITMDAPYRVQRIGYPVLAWLASLGQHALVPVALVAVNVLALSAIGVLGGVFARSAGRHAVWGLLLASYAGLISSLSRDLGEPVAAACMLGAVLAYRSRRPVLAGLLLGYAALSRETVLIVALALGLVRLIEVVRRRVRPGADDLAWLLPLVIFGSWQLVLKAVTGSFTLLATFGSNGSGGLPLSAFANAVRTNIGLIGTSQGRLAEIWFLEVATLLVFLLAAATALRSTTVPAYERIAFAVFVLELGGLSHWVWGGFADLRSINEVYLFSVLILLGARRRGLGVLAVISFMTLAVAAAHLIRNI